jgi:beta-galactosidase
MTPTPPSTRRLACSTRPWTALPLLAALLALPPLQAAAAAPAAGPANVRVVQGPGGLKLAVDGRDFMVLGMNWDYFPIGTNYNYSLWTQPDDVIEAALANEMPLMKRMGVNSVRLYAGIPKRWIQHIYEKYGIWTVLNHTVGRYGYTLDGAWTANVDYSSPRFRAVIKAELAALVEEYRGTPGLLMWLLGNESNYGLSWSSFEIEALPTGEREAAKARHLYSLFGEIIRDTKARDPNHPVAIANGDVQYIDLIASECRGLDVFGVNAYRGRSMGDLYDVVKAKLGVPVMFTEFGADAFDAKRGREDDLTQARYLVAQWKEIYEQSAGKGRAGNAIGGFVFQWSDGWWKFKQETNLEVQDTNASWPNGGYKEDYVEGENNMNEEWWGICAKGPPDARGLYQLQPRTAYYALQQAFRLDPYGPATDLAAIATTFGAIEPDDLAFHYQAAKGANLAATIGAVRLTDVRLSFETYSTGGNEHWNRTDVPNGGHGFDHMESFYATMQVQPTEKVTGKVTVNVLGNVAVNPMDEIYYEKRGLPVTATLSIPGQNPDGSPSVTTKDKTFNWERVKIYNASVAWDESLFHLEGFYRTGHYHWASEGDLFGLYREANYGANADIYDADVPIGMELTGKKQLDGVKLAFGPQLWWGANPTVIGKYRLPLGRYNLTLLHQEDLAQAGFASLSSVVPQRAGRKTTLAVEGSLFGFGFELAGIRSGATRVGMAFLDDQGRPDTVRESDTWGGKAKVTLDRGLVHWYASGAYMGLVADAAPEQRITYTGWMLKDSGSGNQVNALTGLAATFGMFQIAPNFLWQKPLVGPGTSILPFAGGGTASRNIVNDPFSVRSNRETMAGELMLVFDPTPASWVWAWDNDLREDAPFAASLDFSYRHMPTTLDAGFYVSADGQHTYAFPSGVPAANVWEVSARVAGAPRSDLRLVLHGWAGNPQANGDDARQPHRYGGDFRVTWRSWAMSGYAKFNDYGPYDYYRDFNLTFPLQVMGDLSYNLGPARWLWLQQTRIGMRAASSYLNAYSGSRYVQTRSDPQAWGHEYEIRTYLVVTM